MNDLTIPLWSQIDFDAIHPDPQIAREVAIEAYQGALTDAKIGLLRALDYRAVTPEGLAIKAAVQHALEAIQCPAQSWGYVDA
jgi:hypothetical protein